MPLPPLLTRAYVAFEGPLGAGKTTLASLLANRADANLILEDPDGNEFLADFYQDQDRWALPMQLWFIASRHSQLSRVFRVSEGGIIADYSYAKNAVFARLLLKDRDWRLYEKMEAALGETLRRPDVIVYLDADDDVLIDRVRLRGRKYEAPVTVPYLDSVRKAYEDGLLANPPAPIARFNTTALDLKSEGQLTALFETIAAQLA